MGLACVPSLDSRLYCGNRRTGCRSRCASSPGSSRPSSSPRACKKASTLRVPRADGDWSRGFVTISRSPIRDAYAVYVDSFSDTLDRLPNRRRLVKLERDSRETRSLSRTKRDSKHVVVFRSRRRLTWRATNTKVPSLPSLASCAVSLATTLSEGRGARARHGARRPTLSREDSASCVPFVLWMVRSFVRLSTPAARKSERERERERERGRVVQGGGDSGQHGDALDRRQAASSCASCDRCNVC